MFIDSKWGSSIQRWKSRRTCNYLTRHITKKMESAHDHVNTLLKQATNPKLKTRYFSCSENYNDVTILVRIFMPLLLLMIHLLCDDNFSNLPIRGPQLKVSGDKLQDLIANNFGY
ncbi:hypothetical protein H5410_015624 [Solanum commersonii]|uniref:Uncharacterized protein n=1 Tax=Solanum commersonii TaxID=4109 RepID=A0A9J5ZUD0_SOLCO|nr:hypothetical protein H5410_015624 [Solanum commersonii]